MSTCVKMDYSHQLAKGPRVTQTTYASEGGGPSRLCRSPESVHTLVPRPRVTRGRHPRSRASRLQTRSRLRVPLLQHHTTRASTLHARRGGCPPTTTQPPEPVSTAAHGPPPRIARVAATAAPVRGWLPCLHLDRDPPARPTGATPSPRGARRHPTSPWLLSRAQWHHPPERRSQRRRPKRERQLEQEGGAHRPQRAHAQRKDGGGHAEPAARSRQRACAITWACVR